MRENMSLIVVGRQATGKSTFLLKTIKKAYDLKTQKVLILSQTTPPAYQKIKRVYRYEDLKRWKAGPVLFYDMADPLKMLERLDQMAAAGYLRNGALIFEDATNYIGFNLPRKARAFFVNYRMYQLDLFLVMHSLSLAPKFLWQMCGGVVIFKTRESPEQIQSLKKIPNLPEVFTAWQEIMNQPNDHKNRTVLTGI